MNAAASSVPRRSLGDRLWSTAMVVLIVFFVVNVFGVITSVTVSSFATRWLGTWLPSGWTTRWYSAAWAEFQLDEVLLVTMEIVFIVVALAIVIGVPAAYALARRDFPGKKAVLLLFLLPLLVPSITYGIPLATVLYQARLAGTMSGVIVANLVPTVPFVVLVMTPYIEQIDPRLEAAARVFGAGTFRVFRHVLVPLLAPRHPRRGAARPRPHHRDVRADLPYRRAGQPDARRRAVLFGLRCRRPCHPVSRRDGRHLYGDDANLAAHCAALCQPDPARGARQGAAEEIGARGFGLLSWANDRKGQHAPLRGP